MIEPLGHHVLVEPVAVPATTPGGIIRAEQWQQPSGEALVVAVGTGMPNWARSLRVGDKIAYKWINGQEVNFEGRTLRFLEATEILGVIK